jgi:hypothetical protein
MPVPGDSNDHFDSSPAVSVAAAQSLQAGPTHQPATGRSASTLEVAFKLHPSVTGGVQLGERWVSPPTYDTVQPRPTFVVQARAEIASEGGQRATTAAQWTSAQPDLVSVVPGENDTVTITVHRPGQTILQVSAQGMVSELTVSATVACTATRAMFSEEGRALSGPSQICDKRAFVPALSWGPVEE